MDCNAIVSHSAAQQSVVQCVYGGNKVRSVKRVHCKDHQKIIMSISKLEQ